MYLKSLTLKGFKSFADKTQMVLQLFYRYRLFSFDTHLRLEEYAAGTHSRVICKAPERGQGEHSGPLYQLPKTADHQEQ